MVSRAWRRWVALLDTREPATSLAVCRVIVAATVFGTLWHAWGSGAAGVLWVAPEHGGLADVTPLILRWLGGASWTNVRALLVVGLVASAFLGAGAFTRVSALVTIACFRTLTNTNTLSGGAGDDVVSNVLLIVLLSGAGRAWSVDAWRAGPKPTPAWPRYLGIAQLVLIYTGTGWRKLSGSWVPGGSLDAIWYALGHPLWQRAPLPWLASVVPLTQVASAAVWLFEVSAPLLLLWFYFRRTRDNGGRLRRWFCRWDYRAFYLAFGFCFHAGVELTMEVGAFFGGMMALYACCIRPTEWQALARRR